jgi:hypothetical protein
MQTRARGDAPGTAAATRRGLMRMSHGIFGIDTRRDPARERLAPLLKDATAREPRARRLALRVPLPSRSRHVREAPA